MNFYINRSLTFIFIGILWSPRVIRAESETKVITYVTTVQEERKTSRWTLTEWLRIKERMKLMDVWLAMFTDPDKDKFHPEVSLTYGQYRGAETRDRKANVSASYGRMQVVLVNLFASATRLRTLNIDLGLEGGITDKDYSSDVVGLRGIKQIQYAALARVFGKSIQDTSLVVKYGKYTSEADLDLSTSAKTATSQTSGNDGWWAGVEAQIYMLHFLGMEGRYDRFGSGSGDDAQQRSFTEYAGFLEFSLLRLSAGAFVEHAEVRNRLRESEKGLVGTIKLHF